MKKNPSRPLQYAGLWLLVLTLLAGCDRVELAYERGDWLAARWAANLMDLDATQRRDVRQRIQTYRDGPGRQRALELAEVFKGLAEGLSAPPHDQPLATAMDDLLEFSQRIAGDAIPDIVAVLVQLDGQQINTLSRRLDEQLAEEADRDRDARQRRLEDSVTRWTGRLEADQQTLLAGCLDDMPGAWHRQRDWRQQQNRELVGVLEAGAGQDSLTAYYQARWLLDPDQRPDEIRTLQRQGLLVMRQCLLDLNATLTPRQRERAVSRLQRYEEALRNVGQRS